MTRACLLLALATLALGCQSPLEISADETLVALPLTAPESQINPSSSEKTALGRMLFWDPILSGDRTVACATCHHPSLAYADGLGLSIGIGGEGLGRDRSGTSAMQTARGSMTIVNTGFNGLHLDGVTADEAPMFWDNRAASLEEQALEPILSAVEMRGDDIDEDDIFDELTARLEAEPGYHMLFAAAFGDSAATSERIAYAIASYERSLVSTDSSFDRFARGDDAALTHQQKRGLVTFVNSGCNNCHSGPMFSDFKLHRLGIPNTSETDRAEGLRTASLRLVTRTAPYMHNGEFKTLADTFSFYDDVDVSLDPALVDVEPPDGTDADDLIAFLEALSDGTVDDSIPAQVPSGLPVGGLP